MTYKKKLIEVALPLEDINREAAREKSIRHGHPSTLHLWWARRPLAACRAVLFASLVDDPSECVKELLADARKHAAAETELKARKKAWAELKAIFTKASGAGMKSVPDPGAEPRLEEVIVELERERLFNIIRELVKWENSNNERVLNAARAEIMRSCNGKPPPVYDPFCGGGSIPLEAQRLGLEAHASDLNPVPVLINKALIEIPPKFAGKPPVNPESRAKLSASGSWKGAAGLAEDIRYYGVLMRDEAEKRIGHLYPKVVLPKENGGGDHKQRNRFRAKMPVPGDDDYLLESTHQIIAGGLETFPEVATACRLIEQIFGNLQTVEASLQIPRATQEEPLPLPDGMTNYINEAFSQISLGQSYLFMLYCTYQRIQLGSDHPHLRQLFFQLGRYRLFARLANGINMRFPRFLGSHLFAEPLEAGPAQGKTVYENHVIASDDTLQTIVAQYFPRWFLGCDDYINSLKINNPSLRQFLQTQSLKPLAGQNICITPPAAGREEYEARMALAEEFMQLPSERVRPPTKNLFICYRWADHPAPDVAQRLFNKLRPVFPRTFLDLDGVLRGQKFSPQIESALDRTEIGIVLIGPQWENLRNGQGSLKLADPADQVRREIESFKQKNIPIVPVLVDRSHWLDLDGSIQSALGLDGLAIQTLRSEDGFQDDAQKLIIELQKITRSLRLRQ